MIPGTFSEASAARIARAVRRSEAQDQGSSLLPYGANPAAARLVTGLRITSTTRTDGYFPAKIYVYRDQTGWVDPGTLTPAINLPLVWLTTVDGRVPSLSENILAYPVGQHTHTGDVPRGIFTTLAAAGSPTAGFWAKITYDSFLTPVGGQPLFDWLEQVELPDHSGWTPGGRSGTGTLREFNGYIPADGDIVWAWPAANGGWRFASEAPGFWAQLGISGGTGGNYWTWVEVYSDTTGVNWTPLTGGRTSSGQANAAPSNQTLDGVSWANDPGAPGMVVWLVPQRDRTFRFTVPWWIAKRNRWGVVTTQPQTFAGRKTFEDEIDFIYSLDGSSTPTLVGFIAAGPNTGLGPGGFVIAGQSANPNDGGSFSLRGPTFLFGSNNAQGVPANLGFDVSGGPLFGATQTFTDGAGGGWTFQSGLLISYFGASELRFKDRVQTIPNALETICSLRGVTWHWTQAYRDLHSDPLTEPPVLDGPQFGFVVEEAEPVFPALISHTEIPHRGQDPTPVRGVKSPLLIPLLVEAVKTLTARVAALENRDG